MDSVQTTFLIISAISIFESWEDEDRNRYFPLADGRALVRDGCDGGWRGIIQIERPQKNAE
jgi:hypothetical protein